jgi:DNA-directed RNA polymerase subunit RPC12/RpoP
MPYYCSECGGDLAYDSSLRHYVCKSCGLTFTLQDLIKEKEKMLEAREAGEEQRKRRQKEYLKWWLLSREEKRE